MSRKHINLSNSCYIYEILHGGIVCYSKKNEKHGHRILPFSDSIFRTFQNGRRANLRMLISQQPFIIETLNLEEILPRSSDVIYTQSYTCLYTFKVKGHGQTKWPRCNHRNTHITATLHSRNTKFGTSTAMR